MRAAVRPRPPGPVPRWDLCWGPEKDNSRRRAHHSPAMDSNTPHRPRERRLPCTTYAQVVANHSDIREVKQLQLIFKILGKKKKKISDCILYFLYRILTELNLNLNILFYLPLYKIYVCNELLIKSLLVHGAFRVCSLRLLDWRAQTQNSSLALKVTILSYY